MKELKIQTYVSILVVFMLAVLFVFSSINNAIGSLQLSPASGESTISFMFIFAAIGGLSLIAAFVLVFYYLIKDTVD